MPTLAMFILCIAALVAAEPAQALKLVRTETSGKIPGYVKLVVSPSENSRLDVLFVVDNSGSMIEHQKRLAAQVPDLARAFADKELETVQAAVVTTTFGEQWSGGTKDGVFHGTPPIAISGTPDFAAVLSKNVVPGNDGSGTEKIFDPLVASLSSPLVEGPNKGFLRDDAHLAIVMLTDADDQSTLRTGADTAKFLTDLKGTGNFSVYGFLVQNPVPGCSQDQFGQPTRVLSDFIKATGGKEYDLCAGDLGSKMRDVAARVTRSVTRTIPLPSEPVFQTIAVSYGSHPIPAGDVRRGWVYDHQQRSIILGEEIDWNRQPAGTMLEIKYVPVDWTLR